MIDDMLVEFDEMGFAPTTVCPDPEAYAIEWREKVRARFKRLEAENAALRERLEKAVERLKAREQSVCFGWEWKGVVTDKDIDEAFGVKESSLEEPEGGEE